MATAHSTLTGADLHEPKGVASANADDIYVANGSGSGVWTAADNNILRRPRSIQVMLPTWTMYLLSH